jgi:NAD(P)-dependent dehydrogenase (short-subunit alcohol dehydrogenase family)
MTTLNETIRVARPVKEAFAYIADFSTTEEWDSTAISAEKLTDGAIDVGTRFLVRCALPIGAIDLEYVVTLYEPDQRIDLAGSCKFFDINDSIRFTPDINGTRIDYRAEFLFPGPMAPVVERFRAGLDRMGKASMRGMKEALEDNYPAPRTPLARRLGDRLLLPGISDFSRLGYRRGRDNWHPMSAYMGDKHVVVTGASTGLGYATAMELARRGAHLTLVMRNPDKASEVVADITAATGNQHIDTELADLSLLAEVDDLVARLKRKGRPIDVLVNNAGALFNPRGETSEGLEQSVALLLLSPYRLTEGLKPLLQKADAARVINVVSGGMYTQRLDVKALEHDDPAKYSGSVAYARAKRALMVQTAQWARDWEQDGIVVNAMHPGWADTPGVESALPAFHNLTRRILRSPKEGADTIVWLAVATEAGKISGELFLDRLPRSPYLVPGTHESESERAALREFLARYQAPVRKPRQRRKTG